MVPTDQLCNTVEMQDGIPLVVFKSSGKNSHYPSLELIQYDGRTEYVAISHVWGEGLGNPAANELPICQLTKIQDWVNGTLRFEKRVEEQCTILDGYDMCPCSKGE